ncbi:MAG: hypothetical protein HQM15_11580 [Deltaproteobacteria bacterium]|nr:hypothetical protein [Deltaproteobacteria bacterium]
MKILLKKNGNLFLWSVLPVLMLVFTFLGIDLTSRNVLPHTGDACHIYNMNDPAVNNWFMIDYFAAYFAPHTSTLTELCQVVNITDDATCQALGASCLRHENPGGDAHFVPDNCRTMGQYLRCNVGSSGSTPPSTLFPDLTANRSDHCVREYCDSSNCVQLNNPSYSFFLSSTSLGSATDTTSPGCFTPPPPPPPQRCGNGALEPTETCEIKPDPPHTQIIRTPTGTDIFPPSLIAAGVQCRPPGSPASEARPCTYCGDGNIDTGEDCDDGPLNGTDRSPHNCSIDCKKTAQVTSYVNTCGDSIIAGDETCEFKDSIDLCGTPPRGTPVTLPDGSVGCHEDYNSHGQFLAPGVCRAPSTNGACTYCGDGTLQMGSDSTHPLEECDEGTRVNGAMDHCTLACKNPVCGDGLVNRGVETCDGAALSNSTLPFSNSEGCRSTGAGACTYCGDGITQHDAGEDCDNGPNNGVLDPVTGAGCSRECKNILPPPPPRCGDGMINQDSETCDVSSSGRIVLRNGYSVLNPSEGCRTSGHFPCTYCGDHVWQQGDEVCDGSAAPNATGCTAGQTCDNCRRCVPIPPTCGNGNLEPGEACDNRATPTGCADGTYCDASCTCKPNPTVPPPVCGNHILETGEECDPPNPGFCDANCKLTVLAVSPIPQETTPPRPEEVFRLQGSGGCGLYLGNVLGMNTLSLLPYFISLFGFALLRKRKK